MNINFSSYGNQNWAGGGGYLGDSRPLYQTCNWLHEGVCFLNKICNLYGQLGYIAQNCSQLGSQTQSSNMKGKCFEYRQLGHYARDCPKIQ